MTEACIYTIRLDGSDIFLIGQSGNFVLNSSQTLVAFRSVKDARAPYPDATVLGDIVDLDAALIWCSKPQPKSIESVDQSDQLWETIEFLDELEEDGLLDNEVLREFRLADDAALKVLFARLSTVAMIADLSVEESKRLQAMFESGIAAVRRALPRNLVQAS